MGAVNGTKASAGRNLKNRRAGLIRKWISVAILSCFAFAVATSLRGTSHVSASQDSSNRDQDVPSYHDASPKGKTPAVLDPKLFENSIVQSAYGLAADLKKILYQEPCYCYCDRHHQHSSLLDCYTTKHSSECGICLKELFYVYEQNDKGRSPEQIREGMIRGEWKAIDLKKYKSVSFAR